MITNIRIFSLWLFLEQYQSKSVVFRFIRYLFINKKQISYPDFCKTTPPSLFYLRCQHFILLVVIHCTSLRVWQHITHGSVTLEIKWTDIFPAFSWWQLPPGLDTQKIVHPVTFSSSLTFSHSRQENWPFPIHCLHIMIVLRNFFKY